MNRERAKELLPIIQAFAEGKEIEYIQYNNCWRGTNSLGGIEDDDIQWRIKPEPVSVWLYPGYRDVWLHTCVPDEDEIADFELTEFRKVIK